MTWTKLVVVIGLALVTALGTGPAHALVVTFDDLTTRNNFEALGIDATYQGFEWGYSTSPGFSASIIPTDSSNGWGAATVSHPAVSPAPTPVSGSSYAWNWNGPQSLWIDFQSPHTVNGGYFATLSSAYGSNASTIQLFAYDAGGTLTGSSSMLSLTHSFQHLAANLTGARYLEIRANANGRWFSVDNLVLDAVPLSPSLVLVGVGALVATLARRRSAR